MIRDNGDGVQGPLKVIFLFGKGEDDGEEFSVVDVIVPFGKRKGF